MTGNFVNLYKTRKKGETSVLKLKCGWIRDELNILVIDGNTAWSGKFSAEEIENFCEVLGITRDEYITECQQAFSGGEAVENFLFTVENNRFVWRKELGADTRVKFGSINLSPVPLVQALEEFVDFAFETIECCRQEVTDAKNKMEYFERERTCLVQKLEEYTQNKKEFETVLYSKFLCVLNAKKERIAILEQELSDLKSKIQHTATETEGHKCDTVSAIEPISKATRQTRKRNAKPYNRRVQQSPPPMAVDTELQMLSNIPVENNDRKMTRSKANQALKRKANAGQKGQQMAKTNPLVENRVTSCTKEESDPCTSKAFVGQPSTLDVLEPITSRMTSCKKEESDPCTSKGFVRQACEPDILEHRNPTQHQLSKNDTVEQKTMVTRSASPIASTSTSGVPLENHIPVKYETPDQSVPEEKGTCIPPQQNVDHKSSSLVKRSVDDSVLKQIKDSPGSVYSSEVKDKIARKIPEVICPIDLVSQKINTQSDVNKITISKKNKKVVSPAKQYREVEIISPLDMLAQPKHPTPSLVHEDTVCMPKNSSLKQPMQSVNMQDNSNSNHEFSREGTTVQQEAVEDNAESVDTNDINTNSRSYTADATSVTVSSVICTKNQTEGESNHYDSETDVDEPEDVPDVDEPEDVCKLATKHRSVNEFLEESNHSSFTESEKPEVKCDEMHQFEQKKSIENLLDDSQDTDSTLEEIPMASLPKRTRRAERINKCVPIINKSFNHFSKLNHMRDKSQDVSKNELYEQETQIVDTQKLLDELG